MVLKTSRRRPPTTRRDTWMKVKDPAALRRWRKQQRFSQQQLATLIRRSQQTIHLLEAGGMKTCREGVAIGIAAWLCVPWEELFEAEENDIVPGCADSIGSISNLLKESSGPRKEGTGMSESGSKKGRARFDGGPGPESLVEFRGRVRTIKVDAADDDPADFVDVSLEHRGEVRVYLGHCRSVVVESERTARVEIENYGTGVSTTEVFRSSGLEEEAVVAAKALKDHFLIGANDAVSAIDVDALASKAYNHASHEISPSVGASSDAVSDNSNPTDGDARAGAVADHYAGAPGSQ